MYQFTKVKSPQSYSGWHYLLIGIVLLVVTCSVFAADTDDFQSQVLPQNGKKLAAASAELDGVPGAELVLFTVDNQGVRYLKIYSPDATGRYDTIPKIDLELPQGVFGFQVTEMDADQREELLLLALDAVLLMEFDQGRFSAAPKTVTTFERLYALPNPDCVIPYMFAFDLNGDGTKELLLPAWNGVRVLQKKENGYVLLKLLSLAYKADGIRDINLLSGSCSGNIGFHLPIVTSHDLNTDRNADLLVETSSGLSVFYQTGVLQFSERANRVLDIKPSYLEDLFFKTSGLADLNNDRLLDYCRVFTQSSGSDYKTVVEVFFGNLQEGYSTRPSKRIVLDEYGVGLSLIDLDGSGVSAIVIATIPVSPTNMVKALLVKGMPLDLRVYRSEGGIISDQPAVVKRVTCGLNLFKSACPVRYIGTLAADLNADKACDLVIITDDNELQVFPGSRQLSLADKPSVVRKTSGVTSLEIADLNGDAKTDIILFGRDEDGRDVVTLLKTK